MIRAAAVVLMVLTVLTAGAFGSEFSDTLKAVSWQVFVREWGRLSAFCSAGAYWSDGKTTRLLTAGHCVALPQAELGRAVEFIVTQTGSDFRAARVLATGWRLREPAGRSTGGMSFPRAMPTVGVLQAYGDRIDFSKGDWAIMEIDGGLPFAPLGRSADLSEDDDVFGFGYPLGGPRFFSKGYIANVSYDAVGTEWPSGYLAADITAAPGNSGSLIIDTHVRTVAVLVAGAGDRLHILTPIDLIRKAVPCLDQPICVYLKP